MIRPSVSNELTDLRDERPQKLTRRDNKRVADRFVLKADDLWKTRLWQKLHIEDFFHGRLKFKQPDHPPAAQVHGCDAAFQLVAPLGHRHAGITAVTVEKFSEAKAR